MTNIDQLNKYHPDLISLYLTTGECSGISQESKMFLKQLQWAAEAYEFEKNITRAAKKLRFRIAGEQGIDLDIRSCKYRINESISYFNIDNNIPIKVWESNFADRYADLAALCIAARNYKIAKFCMDSEVECRRKSAAAAESERDWAPVFLISTNLTPEMAGFTKKNMKAIGKKSTDGFYLNLIDSFPIDKDEKRRLYLDANITDIEPVEEDTDE